MDLYDEIWALRPSESDFEVILHHFTVRDRRGIYMGMDVWCASGLSEAFLNRRLAQEKDPMCKRILRSRLAKLAGEEEGPGGRTDGDRLPRTDRSADFRRKLKDLLLDHLTDPGNWAASERITSLAPTDEDLDDGLLDSLTAQGRLEVYSMLLVWCGHAVQRKILLRRVRLEPDPACKVAITAMLRSVR